MKTEEIDMAKKLIKEMLTDYWILGRKGAKYTDNEIDADIKEVLSKLLKKRGEK